MENREQEGERVIRKGKEGKGRGKEGLEKETKKRVR